MGALTKYSQIDFDTIFKRFPGLPKQGYHAEAVEIGTVNTFYRVIFRPINKTYYLKIDEVGDEERLKNEIRILSHLEKCQGLLSYKIPIPLLTENKQPYVQHNGKSVLIFSEIPGRSFVRTDLREKHIRMVGEKLFELHHLPLDKKLTRHRYDLEGIKTLLYSIQNDLQKKYPSIANFCVHKLEELEKIVPKKIKTVIIHADLFDDNILWVQNSFSGMIDFEAAGLGPVPFDLAVCLHALCHDGKSFRAEKIRAFFDGYQDHQKLTKNTFKLLSVYLELTALRFLLTRLADFELKGEDAHAKNFRDYKEYVNRFDELKNGLPIDVEQLSSV